jgi:L-2-hydroxyglutarate oxidase LhgO
MIYAASAEVVMKFLNREIAHFELFTNRPNSKVYFSDIDAHGFSCQNYAVHRLTKIPDDYLPSQESYFEEADGKDWRRILAIVGGSVSN